MIMRRLNQSHYPRHHLFFNFVDSGDEQSTIAITGPLCCITHFTFIYLLAFLLFFVAPFVDKKLGHISVNDQPPVIFSV